MVQIANQTYVAAVVWVIMIAAAIFMQQRAKEVAGIDIAINVISLLISAVISLYAINCMVVGQCRLFAWVYVGLMALSVALLIAVLAFGPVEKESRL